MRIFKVSTDKTADCDERMALWHDCTYVNQDIFMRFKYLNKKSSKSFDESYAGSCLTNKVERFLPDRTPFLISLSKPIRDKWLRCSFNEA